MHLVERGGGGVFLHSLLPIQMLWQPMTQSVSAESMRSSAPQPVRNTHLFDGTSVSVLAFSRQRNSFVQSENRCPMAEGHAGHPAVRRFYFRVVHVP